MSIQFINIHGERVDIPETPSKKKVARIEAASYHKGWLVQGIPPGVLAEAEDGHQRVVNMARKAGGQPVAPFDRDYWLMNAKKKRVRSKPYELESAARECAELAAKAGWLRVEVLEQKREAAVA